MDYRGPALNGPDIVAAGLIGGCGALAAYMGGRPALAAAVCGETLVVMALVRILTRNRG